MNNLSESFNSTILLAMDKPIISMMEWIRSYIMSRFATLREKLNAYSGTIMPKPQKRLDKEIEKKGNWLPVWAGDAKFEVMQGFTMEKFVVDLSNHNCSCYFWDLVGIPCRQFVVAINYKVENPEGDPKKLRRKEVDEHVSHSKLSKKSTIIKCSRCKQLGHNIRSCRKGIINRKVKAHI